MATGNDTRNARPAPGLPRSTLALAGALVVVAVIGAALNRTPPAELSEAPPVVAGTTRALHFADGDDGSVLVHDARSGALVARVEPGTNGFLRATLRGLARDRRKSGFGAEQPFRLSRLADGEVLLEDPATGRRVYLRAFGSTNAAAFAALLAPAAGRAPAST